MPTPAFSVAGALALGMALQGRKLPGEAGVGMSYVLAGALVVLGANRLVHAAHDLNAMVFGNAVAVPRADLVALAVVALLCAAVHSLFAKELVFVSFDAETAAALGFDTRLWNGLLFLTLGLAIPVAARTMGALPVFAFLTIPAAAALLLARRLRGGRVVLPVPVHVHEDRVRDGHDGERRGAAAVRRADGGRDLVRHDG